MEAIKAMEAMDEQLEKALKQTFGYSCFRPLQRDIMLDMIAGNDMLILMPTGAGKSICYQLPAIVQGGLTVVISPLISLIYDQIADLKKLPTPVLAHYWCTGVKVSLMDIFTDVQAGLCNLLYTTPESFNNNMELRNLLKASELRRFIIDEAHCLSNWGHDFRSEYLKLNMREHFPQVSICGFTATATKLVCADITVRLRLSDPLMWMTSYVKQNISYRVQHKEKSDWGYITGEVARFIKSEYRNETGIVYCLSRKQCEQLATSLLKFDISAGYYHASMPPEKKTQVQQDWLDGKLKVIVATIAFALGINKPNVRYVVHTSMPNSIEGYYQQAGRAGRDGKLSVALMYYSEKDKDALEAMIDYSQQSKSSPVTPLHRISQMYRFCLNKEECLKVQLSNYLGEYGVKTCLKRGDPAPCGSCRAGTVHPVPLASAVNRILSMIGDKKVNLQHVQVSASALHDLRALNYLLNTEQLVTEVDNIEGKWTEFVWKQN
jgi:hypothetical protein